METNVLMPQLGESVIEGTISKWLKVVGDPVQEFEPLLEVNTDKVDTEVPSPATGTLLEILVPEGTTVSAGTVLARLEAVGAVKPAPAGEQIPAVPAAAVTAPTASPAAAVLPAASGHDHDLGFISPVVSRLAQEHNLDLYQIRGTGLGGRITKKDVVSYLDRNAQEKSQPAPRITPPLQAIYAPEKGIVPPAQVEYPVPASQMEDEVVPLSTLRKAIAEHMVFSERTSPHVTTVMEADMSKVAFHRNANKEAFAREGVNLTFTAYFAAASVTALKANPRANSSWSEAGIVLHKQVNLGIATSLGEEGLIVPVIKNADLLSLLGLARMINDLANRARAHKLQPDEVKNGTFTITNHGISKSLFATPIINQPQCGILGVGLIQKRVVAINDAIAIRPMAYISFTFDHRILDGASADAFLGKVVECLENWV